MMRQGKSSRAVGELARKSFRRAFPQVRWAMRPAILMYHRIAEDPFDPWGLCVPPARFSEQMEWVAKNRIVLDLGEFARHHESRSLPCNAIAITFDDAYASIAREALPLLDRLELRATIFIPAALVQRESEFWWDELARLIIAFEGDRLILAGEGGVELGVSDPTDRHWRRGAPPETPRQKALREIWSRIRTWPPEKIEAALGELRHQIGAAPPLSDDPPMSAAEIRSVTSERVEIGSHALTHPSLPALKPDRRKEEIEGSIPACEAISGERPISFAYPFGEYDGEIEELVLSSGFTCACTSDHGAVSVASRLSALPRVGVGNWPIDLFKRVLLEL